MKGVANAGISGNQVLADGAAQSALKRLDRDALSLPGVRTVVLFEGVNDIKSHTGVTAAALTAGYREIIDRSHAAGLCVVGATVLPFKGWSEWDPEEEAVRTGVNEWIRTSGEVDAVADFDRCCAARTTRSASCPRSTAATICTPTTRACRRWPTRSP